MMKSLVALLALVAVVSFGYPLLSEDSGNECDAFERLAVRLTLGTAPRRSPTPDLLISQFLQGLSKGQFARAEARDRYPNVPATVACTILYWRAVADPQRVPQIAIGRH
jgi:hypothetical protein